MAPFVGVANGGPQRRGLAVVPPLVAQHRDIVGEDVDEVDRPRHHDHLVEAGGPGGIHRMAHQGFAPHLGAQLVHVAQEARAGAGGEHHRGRAQRAALAGLAVVALSGGRVDVGHRAQSGVPIGDPGSRVPIMSSTGPESAGGEPDPTRAMGQPELPLAVPPSVRVTMMLADSAQVADRKLYVLGGGLTVIGPRPQPLGVAIRIEVPWDRANLPHEWRLELLDEDGHPVMVKDQALAVAGRFEAGRPAGLKPGTPLSVPLAITFPTLPVRPGGSYTWQLTIDGAAHEDWRQSFHVRAPAATPGGAAATPPAAPGPTA